MLGRFDDASVAAQLTNVEIDVHAPDVHALVLVGRHDTWVGWRQLTGLLDACPRGTGIVVAGAAGHALPHEQPAFVRSAIRSWLSADF